MALPSDACKSAGCYNRAVQPHLIDDDILPPGCQYPSGKVTQKPANMAEICQAIALPAVSLSPPWFSDEHFDKVERADEFARKERQVTVAVIPFIRRGESCSPGELPFTNLGHLTDGKDMREMERN